MALKKIILAKVKVANNNNRSICPKHIDFSPREKGLEISHPSFRKLCTGNAKKRTLWEGLIFWIATWTATTTALCVHFGNLS